MELAGQPLLSVLTPDFVSWALQHKNKHGMLRVKCHGQ